MSNLDEMMRARFHEAGREKAAILAKTAPQRAEADALSAQADALYARARDILDQVRAIESPLVDLDNERGRLARALNGKTGVA